jgi:hypothetical protein
MKFFYLTMLLIVPTIFIAVLILERGKIKTKSAITEILVGLAFGFSFHITYFYHLSKSDLPFDPRFFLIIPFLMFVWILVPEWYQVVKKRISLLNVLFMTIAILCFLIVPFLSLPWANCLFLLGLPFLISYFILDFRAHKIPEGWIESFIKEAASEVKGKGKYTNKPIVIKEKLNTRFVSRHSGVFILFKKDRILCSMSKKYYKKLGEPNLQEFFEILISKVKVYLEKKSKNKPI